MIQEDMPMHEWEKVGRPQALDLHPWASKAQAGDKKALEITMLGLDLMLRKICANRARKLGFNTSHPRHQQLVDDLLGNARATTLRYLPRWDVGKSSLVTYIYSCVTGDAIRYSRKLMSLIRIPESAHDRKNREKSDNIAKAYERVRHPVRSLDSGVPERVLKDFLVSGVEMDSLDAPVDVGNVMKRALRRLPPRDAQAVSLYFGIGSREGPMTLDGVGKIMGCSREWVRQLVKLAIYRLKNDIELKTFCARLAEGC